MSTSTIEITDGITERTSRIALKRTMSAFGEVDACHMGDRAVMGDRFTEFPIVRFKMQSSAEAALQAIKGGQVFLDGLQLQGEWRGGGGLAVRQRLKAPQGRPAIQAQPEEDTSSRMLLDMPASNSQRPSLDSHNTFTGRDQRREDRDGYSSRRLFDVPANFSGSRTERAEPKRSRSRRRRRSPSRNRKESRSRSRSAKKVSRGGGGGSAAALAALLGLRVIKPQDELSFGNLESAVSDNPLYVGKR
mmetsp:Transcript_85978/g.216412  ORF Transcript_85978/g.216412 Transcript_85978/m.216412 type:complete len:247 (-) Transcript_85978:146-886(-)